MDPLFTLYAGALALASLGALVLAAIAALRPRSPNRAPFVLANLAALAYTLGSIFEISAATPAEVLSSLTLQYLGIATIGPSFLLMALTTTGQAWRLSPLIKSLLYLVPLGVLAGVATNSLHELFYTSIELTRQGPFTVPRLGKGPLYLINLVYMNLTLLLGVLSAIRGFRRAQGLARKSLAAIILAGCIPWLGMALYLGGLSPYGLDVAPFGLALSGVVNAYGFFRTRMLSQSPFVTEQIFACMKEGTLVLDQEQRLIGFNPAMAALLPGLKPSLTGSSWSELRAQLAPLQALGPAEARGASLELRVPHPEGAKIFQVDRSPLQDRRGRPVGTILLFTDITQKVALMERLAQDALTDELTGLPNRRALLRRLEDELERVQRYGSKFSLVLIDVDHFKRVNDTWGHEAGDAVLQFTARLWKSCIRSSDLLARYGGEEFYLLVTETTPPATLTLLERMRAQTEASPVPWGGQNLRVTASFGVSTAVPGQNETAVALMQQADQALYRAKAEGRNRICLAK